MDEIRFFVVYRGEEHSVVTHQYEYRSLMALLYDKFYFEDFGDCKGIGRCGTCHVIVNKGVADLHHKVGNEQTTLNKMEGVPENSRLSCQILITEALDQARFIIGDNGNLGLY